MRSDISGIQEAMANNQRMIAALKPEGSLGKAIKDVTIIAHSRAVQKTHVITGSLRASHRMKVNGLRGEIYIDPTSVNPANHQRPAQYGVVEHARGGTHRFYERVVQEDGAEIARSAGVILARGFK